MTGGERCWINVVGILWVYFVYIYIYSEYIIITSLHIYRIAFEQLPLRGRPMELAGIVRCFYCPGFLGVSALSVVFVVQCEWYSGRNIYIWNIVSLGRVSRGGWMGGREVDQGQYWDARKYLVVCYSFSRYVVARECFDDPYSTVACVTHNSHFVGLLHR